VVIEIIRMNVFGGIEVGQQHQVFRVPLLSLLLLVILFLPSQRIFAYISADTHKLFPGNYNADSYPDIYAQPYSNYYLNDIELGSQTSQSVSFNTSTGTWANGYLGLDWSADTHVGYTGDFNGDAVTDILLQGISAGQNCAVALSNGKGVFSSAASTWNDGALGLVWNSEQTNLITGDFDGNGKDDVLLQPKSSSPTITTISTISDHPDTINQSWDSAYLNLDWSSQSSRILSGDFNGDGKKDLLLQAKQKIMILPMDDGLVIPIPISNGTVNATLLANGNGQFTVVNQEWNAGYLGLDWVDKKYDIRIADFNGDGRDDLLLLPLSTDLNGYLLYADVNGKFTSIAQSFSSGNLNENWTQKDQIFIADYNHDGRADVLFQDKTSSFVTIVYSDVNGQFTNGSAILQLPLGDTSATGASVTSSRLDFPPATSSPPTQSELSDVQYQPVFQYGTMPPAVGRTNSKFKVLPSGAASITIPLDVPPGANDLQPKLSLVYNSQSKAGNAGIGWRLEGLSVIARCSPSIPIDGFTAAIDFDSPDNQRYCIDGQRLILSSENPAGTKYGDPGSIYVTQIRDKRKIIAYGQSGNGPLYFEVKTGDGRLYRYGYNPDSRIAGYRLSNPNDPTTLYEIATPYIYALNHIEDTNHNEINITYIKNKFTGGGAVKPVYSAFYYPKTITYDLPEVDGKNQVAIHFTFYHRDGNLMPQDSINDYSSLDDGVFYNQQFVDGISFEEPDILTEIKTTVWAQSATPKLVKDYHLDYDYDASSSYWPKHLTQFTECAGDGTCFKPLQFAWSGNDINYTKDRSIRSEPDTICPQYIAGRYTLDPKTSYIDNNNYPEGSASSPDAIAPNNYYSRVTGDFNGDGLTDVAVVYTYGDGTYSHFYSNIALSNGDGTFRPGSHYTTQIGADGFMNYRYAVDINGDGFTDFAAVSTGPDGIHIYSMLNDKHGGFGQAISNHVSTDNLQVTGAFKAFPGDANGDGKLDVALIYFGYYGAYAYSTLGNGDGTFKHAVGGQLNSNAYSEWLFDGFNDVAGDFDGDGRMDLAHVEINSISNPGGPPVVNILFSDANGEFHTIKVSHIGTKDYGTVSTETRILAGDVNGDGLTDIVVSMMDVVYEADSGLTAVYHSNNRNLEMLNHGDGTFDASEFWFRYEGEMLHCTEPRLYGNAFLADMNNDGMSDLVVGGGGVMLSHGGGAQPFWAAAGHTLSSTPPALGGYLSNYNYDLLPIDANGDGVLDLALVYSGTGYAIQTGLRTTTSDPIGSATYHPNPNIEMISAYKDSYGNQTHIKYGTLAGEHYLKENSAVYPQMDYAASQYIAERVIQPDGVGTIYATDYYYQGAKINSYRKKGLGYHKIMARDSRTGILTTTTFNQTFPLTGTVAVTETKLPGKVLTEKTTSNWDYAEYSNTDVNNKWYVLKNHGNTQSRYNDDGQLIGTITTINDIFDEFGEAKQTNVSTSDGNTSITYRELVNDTNWDTYSIGKPQYVDVTRSNADYTTPMTRRVAYTYYPTGQVKDKTRDPGNSDLYLNSHYAYDQYGRPQSVTVSGDASAQYPVATRTSTVSYTAAYPGYVYAVTNTNALQQHTSENIDIRWGVKTAETDLNGLVTSYQYDGFGRLTRQDNPDTSYSVFTHTYCASSCPAGALFQTVEARYLEAPIIKYHDSFGRVLRTQTAGLNNETIYQDTKYDNLGRITQTSDPYFSFDTPRWSTTHYDLLNRISETITPKQGRTTYTYAALDNFGLQVNKIQHRIGTYDTADLVTIQQRNVSNQLIQVTDANQITTNYQFEQFGELAMVTDADGNNIHVIYDLEGRRKSMDDPDMGHQAFGFDALGNLRWTQDAKLQTATMTYDDLNRIKSRSEPEGTTSWVYDTGNMAVGKLSSVTSPGSYQLAYGYDNLGRILHENHTIDGSVYSLNKTYDAISRLASVQYPNGFKVSYDYSAGTGYLLHVRNAANNAVLWQAQSMDALGDITQELLGNGLTTQRVYDPQTGYLQKIQTGLTAANEIQNDEYNFDSLGNLEKRINHKIGATEDFRYDALNRLRNVYLNNTLTRQHDYDKLGNILSKSDYGTNYLYGQANGIDNFAGPHAVTSLQLKNGTTVNYRYDQDGNMVAGNGRSISYTSFDKPLTITANGTTLSYSYDQDYKRYKQVSPGKTTIYLNPRWDVGVHYEEVITATSREAKSYLYAGSMVFAIYNQKTNLSNNSVTTEMRYLHKDHLGSVVAITNESAGIVESLSYQVFGERRNASDWSDATTQLTSTVTQHGFTGHEHLDDVGLIHMNARLYDPKLGRFLSADPIVPSQKNLQALNRYTYVYNNPLSLTDQSGNAPDGGAELYLFIPFFGYSLYLEHMHPNTSTSSNTPSVVVPPQSSSNGLSNVTTPNTSSGKNIENKSRLPVGSAVGEEDYHPPANQSDHGFWHDEKERLGMIGDVINSILEPLGPMEAGGAMLTAKAGAELKAAREALAATKGKAVITAGEDVANSTKALPSLQVPNAGGKIVSDVTKQDEVFFRVFSGDSTRGSFLTKVPPTSQRGAVESLALPPGNNADFIQQVLVPAGTRLQRSRALPAFGRRGGKEQFQLLDKIPNENFGPGVPFK